MSQDLLAIKKAIKKRMPVFRRAEVYIKPGSLENNWRKPRGHASKIRRHKRWKPKMPNAGRRTPVALRNYDYKGRKLVTIQSIADLKMLDSKSAGIVASNLGLKSREALAKASVGKKYDFINFKPEAIIKIAEEKRKAAAEKKTMKKKELALKKKEEAKPVEEKAEKPAKPAKPAKPKKGETE